MKKIIALLAMLLATVLWGIAFTAQSKGMDHVGAMLFVMLRSIVGAAALAVVIIVFNLCKYRKLAFSVTGESPQAKRDLLLGGLFCGLIIAAASTFQQLGLLKVSAGKTGFLTALYIIMVPLLGIFFKRKTPLGLYLAVLLALTGAYLLCGGIASIGIGEICVIVCAFLFAIHILVIDHYVERCDCVKLSCVQFTVAAVASAAASLIFREPWLWQKIIAAMPFWIFCGIGSSAIAFTLQMFAQKYLHPVTAALIMSLESVFALLGGWWFLREVLTVKELAGCATILFSVILTQLPQRQKK